MHSVNRWLRWYDKHKDALVGELPLEGLSLATLQPLFSVPAHDPMYDSFPVRHEHLPILQSKVAHPIDLEGHDYFIEADAAK